MFIVFLMISQDHVIKGSCDFDYVILTSRLDNDLPSLVNIDVQCRDVMIYACYVALQNYLFTCMTL